jgi:hypothetical protein
MLRIAFIVLVAFVPHAANAQEVNTRALVNRALGLIDIASKESELGGESDLELTDLQNAAIQEMAKKLGGMLEEAAQLPPEQQADPKIQSKYASELHSIESALTDTILLPHQLSPLLGKVFSRCTEVSGGDMLKAINDYYPDKIKIDVARKGKLTAISESTKKEIAKAKEKFEAEVKTILAKAEDATRELLADHEKKILGTR